MDSLFFLILFQVFCMKSEEIFCWAVRAHPANMRTGRGEISIPQWNLFSKLCLQWRRRGVTERKKCAAWSPTEVQLQTGNWRKHSAPSNHGQAPGSSSHLISLHVHSREDGQSGQCFLLSGMKWILNLLSSNAASYLICQGDSCTMVLSHRDYVLI